MLLILCYLVDLISSFITHESTYCFNAS